MKIKEAPLMSKALGGYLRVLLELSSIWYMNNIYPKRCQESVRSALSLCVPSAPQLSCF